MVAGLQYGRVMSFLGSSQYRGVGDGLELCFTEVSCSPATQPKRRTRADLGLLRFHDDSSSVL